MKIALVRRKYSPYGGAERYMEDLSIRLAGKGYEVHIFSHQWPSRIDIPSILIHPVPMIRGQGLIELMTFNWNVSQALAKDSFDIIQSFEKTLFQDLYHGEEGCHRQWLLQRRRYEPLVSRMGVRLNPFHWITLALEKRLFESSPTKYFIAISNRGRKEIISHYPQAKDRIRVIYNGLELIRPTPGMGPGLKKGGKEKKILFAGSGFFRKGLFFLVKALPELQKTGPVGLMVVGRDNQNKARSLAEKEKVADRITWIGQVNNVAPYYQEADVFVLPSIYEPFGNVCLEAMAYGLPVVTSEAAGVSEWIMSGKNGFVIKDPADIQALTEAITSALKLDKEQVQKADEMILPQFSWDRHIENLSGVYQEVLLEKKGGKSVLPSL